jgi:hypothetical protein
MILFPSINKDERIGNRWVKEKEVPRHILNRKADKKLDYVASLFEMAMDEKFSGMKSGLLDKTLYCEGFYYIKELNLKYSYENRFWAFSYNLDYKTTIEHPQAIEKLKFIVENKGKMAISDARWIDSGSNCSKEETEHYLNRLNNRLIIDRIVDLDMTRVEVSYNPNSQRWTIGCRTLIGSTTWVLIPPVMHLIKPRPVECVKALEFLELVADAIIQK